MSYTDDAVKAKLSALNETQDSIVTVAQWVMFHRRYADRTAMLWLNRLKDSGSNKRLNLVYLANEVVQQSKARRKEDFLIAFSPIIAEASAVAYKGATNEVQNKLRRVVEVWRQRQIFEGPIQEAIEARIDDLDRSRSSSKKPALGGSLFSSSSGPSAPPEIQPLVPLQIAVSKAVATTTTTVPNADTEYEKLTDPTKPVPTPPVYAARLSALLRSLASAESAVSESIKTRRSLLEGLEKLVETNKASLAADEAKGAELTSRKAAIEAKKREVEDGIMRGLSAENSPVTPGDGRNSIGAGGTNGTAISPRDSGVEPERPDVEELTPPPPDMTATTTPPGDPSGANDSPNGLTSHSSGGPTTFASPPPPFSDNKSPSPPAAAAAGSDLLSSLNIPGVRPYGTAIGNNNNGYDGSSGGVTKKRKMDDESDFFGAGGADSMVNLDADVEELLRAESGGR